MDITKSREEFEAFVKSETGLDLHRTSLPLTKNEDQQYVDHDTNLAWLFWKASRESIEVELPAKVLEECEFDRGHNFRIDYCIVSLEESGIRIKGETNE
ncbi:hypothetical protein [Yersinia proxima]|uniref:hypothetical protein n=1 Tax=Yersinia proxima TaxID=2890316 RepID=UPI001D100FDE|nr:hypothetical protein [Yersinia proxima]